MQEIKAICNRVIIINKGEIVADYPDISKISQFGENNLLFEVEFLNVVEITGIEGINAISAKNKNTYTVSASRDIRAELFDFAVKSGNKILTMKAVERSMEEVFRSLTAPNP
jgi:ABC-2 type transport system ATP-binding protein